MTAARNAVQSCAHVNHFLLSLIGWTIRLPMRLLGRHKLKNDVEMLPLGTPIEKADELYIDLVEVEEDEDAPGVSRRTYQAGWFHFITIVEWKGLIHGVTYWCDYSHPTSDLVAVMKAYQGDSKWVVLTEGYQYLREDRFCRLFCSAFPPIFIATNEVMDILHPPSSDKGS